MSHDTQVGIRRLSFLALAGVLIATTGCRTGPATPATPAVAHEPLERFTLPVEGTSVRLEMVPIEQSAGGGGFYASDTEITWDLYDAFIFNLDTDAGASTAESDAVTRPSKPYVLVDRGYGHAGFAALSISPKAAEQLVEWLSVKTGRRFRIPSEAEMTLLLETSGATDSEEKLALGWFEENSDYTTRKVGSRPADANDLHDVWGNVSEYAVAEDGSYIVMGGSFVDPVEDVGLTYRKPFTPDWNADDPQIPKSPWWLASNDWVGLRVVCDP